jgi:hypothetical protein
MMVYPKLVPKKPIDNYVPRVFGFRIHPSSESLPRGKMKHTTDIYRCVVFAMVLWYSVIVIASNDARSEDIYNIN